MRLFFAIIRRELADATITQNGKRLTQIHLAIALIAVLLGWPVSYAFGQARWAPALAWWVYAELLTLSYLAIAVPADALENPNEIRPGDWISYGEVAPWSVHIAQTLAIWLAIGFWLLTSIPAFLLGAALTPVDTGRLLELAVFAALLLAALTQIGTWIGVTIDSKSHRIIFVDLAYACVMIGTLFLQAFSDKKADSPLLAQPIEVAARILKVSAKDALFGSAAGTMAGLSVPVSATTTNVAPIPWVSIIAVYGGIFIVGCILTILILRQWDQRHNN